MLSLIGDKNQGFQRAFLGILYKKIKNLPKLLI